MKASGMPPRQGRCRATRSWAPPGGSPQSYVTLVVARPDLRPAIVCDDVTSLEVFGVQVNAATSRSPLVFPHGVLEANIDRVRSAGAAWELVRRQ